MRLQTYFGIDNDENEWLLVQRSEGKTVFLRRFKNTIDGLKELSKFIKSRCEKPRICIKATGVLLKIFWNISMEFPTLRSCLFRRRGLNITKPVCRKVSWEILKRLFMKQRYLLIALNGWSKRHCYETSHLWAVATARLFGQSWLISKNRRLAWYPNKVAWYMKYGTAVCIIQLQVSPSGLIC